MERNGGQSAADRLNIEIVAAVVDYAVGVEPRKRPCKHGHKGKDRHAGHGGDSNQIFVFPVVFHQKQPGPFLGNWLSNFQQLDPLALRRQITLVLPFTVSIIQKPMVWSISIMIFWA